MVVYADVLVVLNLLVNYFIILASAKFLRKKVRILRILFGSFIGAAASLYIFLPEVNLAAEVLFKIVLCLVITLTVFGIKSVKSFLKASGVLFTVTCAYAGIMIAVWKIFKPNGMVINNSVVYFNISPLMLVAFSAAAYIIFTVIMKVFARNNIYAKDCDITVFYGDKTVNFKAIVDTGNSVCDLFGRSEVIIVDPSIIDTLFISGDIKNKTRYRAIPYNSVSGYGMLDGYRCDKGIIISEKKEIVLKEPILAASKTQINDEYEGIVNPEILD